MLEDLQKLMQEFFETHHYDETPRDWQQVPETFDDPDDEE